MPSLSLGELHQQGIQFSMRARLPQIHIPPDTLTAVPRGKPQIQPVLAAGDGVAGPAVGGRPLRAVLRAVDPPRACAGVVGGVYCAAVCVELLGGTAIIGHGAGGEGRL